MDKARYTFFPGCSLKASGHENMLSLKNFCDRVGVELSELSDWNCCGSSSAHSIDHGVARQLPFRNLSLAPAGQTLLIACPSCLIRLKQSHNTLKASKTLQQSYQENWGRPFDPDLEIIPFFELFNRIHFRDYIENPKGLLKGMKVAPYYGCMLSMPPDMRRDPSYSGLMEDVLTRLGAEIIPYGYETICCGTYLSVAKPEVVEKTVTRIVSKAGKAGAECLATACSMCHLNLEIRCSLEKPLPTFHFSELLSMTLGGNELEKCLSKHMVDPVPLLRKRGLLPESIRQKDRC